MLPKFEYHIPETVEAACRLKKELGDGAEFVAGGTDTYAKMHNEGREIPHIIDLKYIPGLCGIAWEPEKGLTLGALTTHHEIANKDIIKKKYPVLAEGVMTIGSYQVRNRGTIGGNICTAAPSADGIGPLLVLDALCEIAGSEGIRQVPLENFFTGPKKTVLKHDELLTRIFLPPVSDNYGGAYFKYGRRNAMEIALQAVSVYLEVEGDGKTCSAVRIALATSAPTPIRARETEKYLLGVDLTDDEKLARAGEIVLTEANPRSSWRASAEFRKDLLLKLVPRTVKTAYGRIGR